MNDLKSEFGKFKLNLALGEIAQKKLLLSLIANSYINAAVLYVFGEYHSGLNCMDDIEEEEKSKRNLFHKFQ